ncbi:MAG: DNA polymerase III subunit delta [Acidimicrobiales bacterium]|nr:DNA polymerase III subunit delta [Acidimicrobiales bacterium]MCB9372836.1 DNA polymerase III subunit delta [Microthrixaceae bacterium]
MGEGATVVLVRGDDPVLVGDEVRRVVAELVGDGDRGLLVDEYAGEEYELAAAVDAAQTLPFLTDHRIVVVRNLGRFAKGTDLAPLLAFLGDPAPTTSLVLVWEPPYPEKGPKTPPKKLLDAVKSAGGTVTNTTLARPADRKAWVDAQLAGAAVRLDREAQALVTTRLADDVERLAALLATLEGAFGPGAGLGAADVEPYLGEAGTVPPWELTDAIDRGDIPLALDRLHRTLGAGDRHPLQVMASLHAHVARMVRLDGAAVGGEKDAAALLGLKGSTFPARKALEQGRRLGTDRLRRAVHLLAQADLDLRGAKAWPPELVMEVLVARMARLSRR